MPRIGQKSVRVLRGQLPDSRPMSSSAGRLVTRLPPCPSSPADHRDLDSGRALWGPVLVAARASAADPGSSYERPTQIGARQSPSHGAVAPFFAPSVRRDQPRAPRKPQRRAIACRSHRPNRRALAGDSRSGSAGLSRLHDHPKAAARTDHEGFGVVVGQCCTISHGSRTAREGLAYSVADAYSQTSH